MTRSGLFEAIRPFAPGKRFTPAMVTMVDGLADRLGLPRAGMHVSAAGIALIKEFEGLGLKAYPDPASGGHPWTVGVGHTGPDVRPGLVITEADADRLLTADLATFEAGVAACAPITTQSQFDALVAFAFNVGLANLQSSMLLKKHRAGDYDGAAGQFAAWNKAGGKVMAGLTRRRAAEARLYRGLAA